MPFVDNQHLRYADQRRRVLLEPKAESIQVTSDGLPVYACNVVYFSRLDSIERIRLELTCEVLLHL